MHDIIGVIHGNARKALRLYWFASAEAHIYRKHSLGSEEGQFHSPLDEHIVGAAVPYAADETPVFVGRDGLLANHGQAVAFSAVSHGRNP